MIYLLLRKRSKTNNIHGNYTVGIKKNSTRIYKRSFSTTSPRRGFVLFLLEMPTDIILLNLHIMNLESVIQQVVEVKLYILDDMTPNPVVDKLINVLSKTTGDGSTVSEVMGMDMTNLKEEALKPTTGFKNPRSKPVINDLDDLREKLLMEHTRAEFYRNN